MGAVRWLCQPHAGLVVGFILAELPLNSREIFALGQACKLKSSASTVFSFANHVGYTWQYQCLCLSFLSCSICCVLPQCAFVEKAAEAFPSHLGRGVSPRAGPLLPVGGTSPTCCLLQHLPCCQWHWNRIIVQKHPTFIHPHGGVFCFSFAVEFQLQKPKVSWLSYLLLSSYSYLEFLLGFFFDSLYSGITSSWCRTWVYSSTKTVLMTMWK